VVVVAGALDLSNARAMASLATSIGAEAKLIDLLIFNAGFFKNPLRSYPFIFGIT